MTRIIAFASALLMLPIFYGNAISVSDGSIPMVLTVILHDWRDTLFLTLFCYPAMLVAGHLIWLGCRAFNFAMRKLA